MCALHPIVYAERRHPPDTVVARWSVSKLNCAQFRKPSGHSAEFEPLVGRQTPWNVTCIFRVVVEGASSWK